MHNMQTPCRKELTVTGLVQARNTFCGTWYLPHSQVHNDQTVPIKILAILPLIKGYIAYFSLRMHDMAILLLLI